MSEAIAQKLDEARALIEKGWCRNDYSSAGRFCAVGAIQMAVTGDAEVYTPEAHKVENALKAVVGESIIGWNDAQKSKRPVIRAFKRAADLARHGLAKMEAK